MLDLDINYFIKDNTLVYNLTDDVKFHGKIDVLIIKRGNLDLSDVECKKLSYSDENSSQFENIILPNSLEVLYCSGMKLKKLPKLPDSLKELYCTDNELTELPDLPNSLKKLYCYYNKLINLPKLPDQLEDLSCGNNDLTELPDLPDSLRFVKIISNKIKSIPKLPSSLVEMNFTYNPIESLYYEPDLKFEKEPFFYGLIVNGFGRIYNMDYYYEYMKKIKPMDKKQKLIDEIKDKVPEEDVVRLHSMNKALGNTSEKITDLISCKNIQYVLKEIYHIDEDLF